MHLDVRMESNSAQWKERVLNIIKKRAFGRRGKHLRTYLLSSAQFDVVLDDFARLQRICELALRIALSVGHFIFKVETISQLIFFRQIQSMCLRTGQITHSSVNCSLAHAARCLNATHVFRERRELSLLQRLLEPRDHHLSKVILTTFAHLLHAYACNNNKQRVSNSYNELKILR